MTREDLPPVDDTPQPTDDQGQDAARIAQLSQIAWMNILGHGALSGESFLSGLGARLFQSGSGHESIEYDPDHKPIYNPDGTLRHTVDSTEIKNTRDAQRVLKAITTAAEATHIERDWLLKLASAESQGASLSINDGARHMAVDTIEKLNNTDWGRKILADTPQLMKLKEAVEESFKKYPDGGSFRQAVKDGRENQLAEWLDDPENGAMIKACNLRQQLEDRYGINLDDDGKLQQMDPAAREAALKNRTEAERVISGEMYLTRSFGETVANKIIDRDVTDTAEAFFSDEDIKNFPDLAQFKGKTAHQLVNWARDQANINLNTFYQSALASPIVMELGHSSVPGIRYCYTGSNARGFRNNNFGNINNGSFARNLPGYAGSDGRFARFATPEDGLRAMNALLDDYEQKYGLNTVQGIVSRWAPPGDNNNTAWYYTTVAKKIGLSSPSDVVTSDKRAALISAMTTIESGYDPFGEERIKQILTGQNISRPGETAQSVSIPGGDAPVLPPSSFMPEGREGYGVLQSVIARGGPGTDVLKIVSKYYGVHEVRNNGVVTKLLDNNPAWQNRDPSVVPWCAGFVGAAEEMNGRPGNGSLWAASYANYGTPVKRSEARPGDIAVFNGHVGYFVAEANDGSGRIWLAGGNQGDRVNVEEHSLNNFIGFRRPPGARLAPALSADNMSKSPLVPPGITLAAFSMGPAIAGKPGPGPLPATLSAPAGTATPAGMPAYRSDDKVTLWVVGDSNTYKMSGQDFLGHAFRDKGYQSIDVRYAGISGTGFARGASADVRGGSNHMTLEEQLDHVLAAAEKAGGNRAIAVFEGHNDGPTARKQGAIYIEDWRRIADKLADAKRHGIHITLFSPIYRDVDHKALPSIGAVAEDIQAVAAEKGLTYTDLNVDANGKELHYTHSEDTFRVHLTEDSQGYGAVANVMADRILHPFKTAPSLPPVRDAQAVPSSAAEGTIKTAAALPNPSAPAGRQPHPPIDWTKVKDRLNDAVDKVLADIMKEHDEHQTADASSPADETAGAKAYAALKKPVDPKHAANDPKPDDHPKPAEKKLAANGRRKDKILHPDASGDTHLASADAPRPSGPSVPKATA